MTAPAIDTTEITLEDIAPVCEIFNGSRDKPCHRVAEWVGIRRCCGKVTLMCTAHVRKTRELMDKGYTMACKPCNVFFADIDPYISLERL